MRTYVFKKKKWRILARLADFVGFSFHRPPERISIDPKRVLVVRLDQLGDIAQTLPVFASLKASFPNAKVDFLTTSAGRELMEICRFSGNILAWDCPWFDRKRKPTLSSRQVKDWVRKGNYDVVLELRGDVRLMIFLKGLGIKNLVGYGATGGGLLLDVHVPWDAALPAVDRNLKLLKAIGGEDKYKIPEIILKGVPSRKGKTFRLCVHPDAGTPAKKWSVKNYVQIINDLLLMGVVDIRLIGLNEKLGEEIESQVSSKIKNEMGKTTLSRLISILSQSDGLLTNDSGPGHLMAALGKPVWVVWSGTAEAKVWAPRGTKVHLFEHSVDCAPCSLSQCPVPGHPCLLNITPQKVSSKIKEQILKMTTALSH